MLGGVSMAEERQIFQTRKHFSRNVFLLPSTFIYFDFIVYFPENRFYATPDPAHFISLHPRF